MDTTFITKKDAICILISTDPVANEKAYWTAIKSGASQVALYVLGKCETVRELDKGNKYITEWIDDPYYLINSGVKAIYIQAESNKPVFKDSPFSDMNLEV